MGQNTWTFFRVWTHSTKLPFRKYQAYTYYSPCQHWIFFLILANLIGEGCYLTIILISFITWEVGHVPFVYWSFYISPLASCLFLSFAHFSVFLSKTYFFEIELCQWCRSTCLWSRRCIKQNPLHYSPPSWYNHFLIVWGIFFCIILYAFIYIHIGHFRFCFY